MFGKSIKLFRIFGFTVRIDLSWLIIVVLVVWSLADGWFPDKYPGLAPWAYVLMGLGGALALFASIVFHELSHSLVARRFGLPMKGITLFIFGGVAQMTEEPRSPKVEFLMAIAGPISSVLLAAVFAGGYFLGKRLAWPTEVNATLGLAALMNGTLVAFNLIPGFPLDGGRVLRSLLWHYRNDLRWATRVASRIGTGFGAVLIGLGVLSLLTGGPAIFGMWWILIGLFLRSAAKQGYQQVLIRQALEGESLRRFMTEEPVAVPPHLSLQDLVDDYIYKYHFKMFPITEGGRLLGCVTTRQVKDVPRDQWATRTVGEVASPCSEENTIAPNEDAVKALSIMSRNHTSRLMVVEDDHLIGILTLKDLMKFLSLKLELESGRQGRSPFPDED